MTAEIKPNVISQHKIPISKSALSLILFDAFGWGARYLHETAEFVNTRVAGDHNCHSYSSARRSSRKRAPSAKEPRPSPSGSLTTRARCDDEHYPYQAALRNER